MRTTKRFTTKVLARFLREQRGQGTHGDFKGWHRVTRGDPASRGRSHIMNWRERLRDLLSDGEMGAQLFISMLQDLFDCLEQFPLDAESSPHLLARYGFETGAAMYPGTVELATRLGIKHPMVHGDGETGLWRPSTDFVLVLHSPGSSSWTVLAVAYKPDGYDGSRRTKQLLKLEREYWVVRGVQWLLITPSEFEEAVVLTLRRTAPWALVDETTESQRKTAASIVRSLPGRSITAVLQVLDPLVGSFELAQRALWQAIWFGELPVDLRRGWRPHWPLDFVSAERFAAFNPIASRRSAWI